MRWLFITALLSCCGLFSYGQSFIDLSNHYNAGDYGYVLKYAVPQLETVKEDSGLLVLIGRSLADSGNYDAALPYLERAVEKYERGSWQRGWSNVYLGLCYYSQGKTKEARAALEQCVRERATVNCRQTAQVYLALLGLTDDYDHFVVKESAHLRFHFQPEVLDSIPSVEKYINAREEAYDAIKAFFKGDDLSRKIDFYVWLDRDKARKLLHSEIGFSKPALYVIHSYYRQTTGHEITHVLSHHLLHPVGYSLLNEGIAVYLDQTGRDKIQIAKAALSQTHNDAVHIKNIWNSRVVGDNLSYPLMGAFVEYLIAQDGRQQFLKLLKDQRYENAQIIYGADHLDLLIASFEKMLTDP